MYDMYTVTDVAANLLFSIASEFLMKGTFIQEKLQQSDG